MTRFEEIKMRWRSPHIAGQGTSEEIGLLCEYVEAAEGKMKADHDYRLGKISIYGFQAKLDVYLSARRKLGLDESTPSGGQGGSDGD